MIQAICVDANGYGRRQLIISEFKEFVEIKPLENPTIITDASRDGINEYQNKKVLIDLSCHRMN